MVRRMAKSCSVLPDVRLGARLMTARLVLDQMTPGPVGASSQIRGIGTRMTVSPGTRSLNLSEW